MHTEKTQKLRQRKEYSKGIRKFRVLLKFVSAVIQKHSTSPEKHEIVLDNRNLKRDKNENEIDSLSLVNNSNNDLE